MNHDSHEDANLWGHSLTHEDWQVRLKAGIHTYAIAPEEARKALQWLRETRIAPFCGEGGFFLSGIDRGEYTPT
ncbi:DUF2019 domain-containing protein [Aquabacter cavernae]|uniref:DUF2019 domain-containing protein n=1 Tax=Aquabacter cavernae TaxID=2496029 RepID=UPI000F8E4142